MISKSFYKIAREILSPVLKPLGFRVKTREYIRTLESGVVHLICVSKDPHEAESFGVMCGVDAIQLKEENIQGFGYTKADNLNDLTDEGWDINSARWPCDTEEKARKYLIQAKQLIMDLAIPWLDKHKTLSSVANEITIPAMSQIAWMKARLYALDGDFDRAYAAIDDYTEWAKQPRRWGIPEHQQEDIDLAAKTRKEIEEMGGR